MIHHDVERDQVARGRSRRSREDGRSRCSRRSAPGIKADEASALQRVQRFHVACVHVRFFALASRRAKVAAVTRTRFDRAGKELVREALEGRCSVETDAEVPADTRRIDVWVTPHDGASMPDHLGYA